MLMLSDNNFALSVLRLVLINYFYFFSSLAVMSPNLSDLGLILAILKVASGFTLLEVLSPYLA